MQELRLLLPEFVWLREPDMEKLDQFLAFAKPYINQDMIQEVTDSMESGWLTTGPKVKKFEQQLQAYLGAPHALTVSSATAGLHLALLALGVGPGDEVITTPMTFACTLNVIELVGASVKLVDVDPRTYNMNIEALEAAITPQTKVIMPVHFAGLPVDLDPLYKLADQYGLRVIEDSAHAIGAQYKEKRIGSFGDIQVFSFHPNKNMTTGEGGCVCCRDDALAEKIMLLRFHGMDREAWDRFGKKGQQHYQIIAPGYKYNMMDIQAAMGIHQLPLLDDFIAKRTKLVARYLEAFEDVEQFLLPQSASYAHTHAWHLFAPRLKEAQNGQREQLMAALKMCNIGTGLHYQAAHIYPYYQNKYAWKPNDFSHAYAVGESILSLPLFYGLTEAVQDQVIAIIKEQVRKL